MAITSRPIPKPYNHIEAIVDNAQKAMLEMPKDVYDYTFMCNKSFSQAVKEKFIELGFASGIQRGLSSIEDHVWVSW